MNERTRQALLIAPLVPAALLFLGFVLIPPFFGAASAPAWPIILAALIVSYLSAAAFGLPTLALLKRIRLRNVLMLTLAAAIWGVVVWYGCLAVLSWLLGSNVSAPKPTNALWGAGFGALVGLPFGLIAGLPLVRRAA
jgi:hypothetical protein